MTNATATTTRDPDADAWLAYFETKRGECIDMMNDMINVAFRVVSQSLDVGETEGGVAVVLFALDEERDSLYAALQNLLIPFRPDGRMANVAGASYSYARDAKIDRVGDALDNGSPIGELVKA